MFQKTCFVWYRKIYGDIFLFILCEYTFERNENCFCRVGFSVHIYCSTILIFVVQITYFISDFFVYFLSVNYNVILKGCDSLWMCFFFLIILLCHLSGSIWLHASIFALQVFFIILNFFIFMKGAYLCLVLFFWSLLFQTSVESL